MSTADAFANVTVPGPSYFDQVVVTAPGGVGNPSSVTVPSSDAVSGSVTVRAGPASTTGAVFPALAAPCVASVPLSRTAPALLVSMLVDPFQPRPEATNDQSYDDLCSTSLMTP